MGAVKADDSEVRKADQISGVPENALIISLGVPAFVMFFFGGAELLQPTALTMPSQALLGRGLQLFFIALLASLPGLLYFQYERQQVTTLRDKFLREIMLLNPSVHTLEDAEIMYGSMVEEISGVVGASARQYFLLGAGRPIFLTTLLVTLAWLLILLPIGVIEPARETTLYEFLAPAETAIGFTFLGTYFFALNLIPLAIQDDEWLDYLLHWRELNRSHGRVYSWEDFYSEKGMRLIVPEPTDSEKE